MSNRNCECGVCQMLQIPQRPSQIAPEINRQAAVKILGNTAPQDPFLAAANKVLESIWCGNV